MGPALIMLALNCGFSKAEIATLRLDEVVESGKHTFIKRARRKTGAYGEWILWPETLAALDFLARFRRAGEDHAVVNRAGQRLDRGGPSGNENQVIKNHWDRVCRRLLAEHPGHLRLPFKHLRKTGATMLRHLKVENAAELASMYLAHGEAADSADSLLPAYTSRPWRKLHKALWKLRRKLLPVLTSVEIHSETSACRTPPRRNHPHPRPSRLPDVAHLRIVLSGADDLPRELPPLRNARPAARHGQRRRIRRRIRRGGPPDVHHAPAGPAHFVRGRPSPLPPPVDRMDGL